MRTTEDKESLNVAAKWTMAGHKWIVDVSNDAILFGLKNYRTIMLGQDHWRR